MIRNATYNDLDMIMSIVNKTICIMKEEGNPQWNEDYPTRNVFQKDIDTNSLYVYVTQDDITIGFICINDIEPYEYSDVIWSNNNAKEVTYLHRMAIDPDYRRQGVGTSLLEFAFTIAKESNSLFLRTDTNSTNIGMNALFKELGYIKRGEIHLREVKEHFNCYDKEI